jgi:hypothetical protein
MFGVSGRDAEPGRTRLPHRQGTVRVQTLLGGVLASPARQFLKGGWKESV